MRKLADTFLKAFYPLDTEELNAHLRVLTIWYYGAPYFVASWFTIT